MPLSPAEPPVGAKCPAQGIYKRQNVYWCCLRTFQLVSCRTLSPVLECRLRVSTKVLRGG
jgi:hypothetical protein